MAKWGECDFKQLEELQKRLEKMQKADMQKFCREASKELAARLLRLVIPNTPTGTYPADSGKVGGTLKRGWTAQTESEAESGNVKSPAAYAASLPITQNGNTYTVEIINPVHYASYVEYGHRQTPGRFVPAIGKRLKKGWVEGRFMLTKSEMKLESQLPKIIEKKLLKFLGDTINND